MILRIFAITLKAILGSSKLVVPHFFSTMRPIPLKICRNAGTKAGTLEIPVSGLPFVIIYRVRKEAVEVVRILHGARQWP